MKLIIATLAGTRNSSHVSTPTNERDEEIADSLVYGRILLWRNGACEDERKQVTFPWGILVCQQALNVMWLNPNPPQPQKLLLCNQEKQAPGVQPMLQHATSIPQPQ